MRKQQWLLLILLAFGLGYQTFMTIDRPFLGERLPRHEAIVRGQAEIPYRYRLLAPWSAELGIRALEPRLGRESAFLAAFLIYDLVGYTVTLTAIALLLLALGHQAAEALLGAVFMAAVIPLTLQRQWYQPWSILEPGLLALGIIFVLRGAAGRFIATTVLATLNRETGIYVALAAVTVSPRQKSSWIALASGIGVLLLARAILGGGSPEVSLRELWALNSQPPNIRAAVLTATLVLGLISWVAFQGLPSAPRPLRRLSLLIPLHLSLIAVFGVWMETRLLLPLLVVLIPLAWDNWFPPGTRFRT